MKVRHWIAILLACALLFPVPARAAENGAPTDEERFGGKDWDTVVAEFMEARSVRPDSVGIAYYNTVTGEEHFVNGDRYRFSASVFKLPLNMYFGEQVALGNMSMDDKIGGLPYSVLQLHSLEYSNNQLSELLQMTFGGWENYKAAIAHLIADDPSEIDEKETAALWYTKYTPRQILHALKLLYNDPDHYPDVLEHLKNAQQDNFFALYERRFKIAHKYGFFIDEEKGLATINDCGVIYTDDPILLVLFTDHTTNALDFMGKFSTLMCDWTQYARGVRLAEEAEQARLAAEAEAAEQARLAAEEAERAEQARLAAEEAEKAEQARLAAEEAERAEQARLAAEEAEKAEQARLAAEAAEKEAREKAARRRIVCAAAGALLLAAVLIFGKRRRVKWILSAAVVAALALAMLLLSGCAAETKTAPAPETPPPAADPTPVPTPVPTPEPTPVPTPEPTPEPIRVKTLRADATAEEILALAETCPELRYLNGTLSTQYAAMMELAERLPGCEVTYTVDLGGVGVGNHDESAVLDGASLTAGELIERLAWLPKLSRVDICPLKLPDADCIAVAEAYPEKDVVWTVHFGKWDVRTDATCFSTLNIPNAQNVRYTDADFAPLFKYCKRLVALDLGHNNIVDLSPLAGMKQLQVLILGDNTGILDVSPLAELTELRYLEYFMSNYPTDFSCLRSMTHMTDLCVGFCPGLKDISFLYDMPELETCWLPYDGFTAEQQAEARAARPDVRFLFHPTLVSSTSDGWRATAHNLAVRKAFTNWRNVVDFRSIDDVEYREGVWLVPVQPSYE